MKNKISHMTHRKYRHIAQLKTADACLQALCFFFMICCFCVSSVFGVQRNAVVIMAGSQVLSAVLWCLAFAGGTVTTRAGRFIRVAFIVVPLLLAATFSIGNVLILYVAYAMIFVGPVLGFSYFLITLFEICFYRGLAQSDD